MFIKSNNRLRTIFIGSTIGIAVNASQRLFIHINIHMHTCVCIADKLDEINVRV